jgi:hypothetical protein
MATSDHEALGPGPPPDRPALHTRRSKRYSRAGSVLLAYDFLLALPTGAAAGILVAFSRQPAEQAPTILLAITALLATLAGIVIAAHTIVVSLISPEYMLILERAQGGIRAVSRPYKIVIWVCAIGVLVSLLAALGWSLLPTTAIWYWRVSRAAAFGVPLSLAAWGLLGSVKLAGESAWHLEQRTKLLKLLRETRDDRQRRPTDKRSA